jgi:predicted DNA-binding antitoxin AbrB/MazE fold protein
MTIKAVYQNGVFRPLQPLEITEGTEVEVTVPKKRKQPPTPEEVAERLQRIADLPLQPGPYFTGEDHDTILYGKPKK